MNFIYFTQPEPIFFYDERTHICTYKYQQVLCNFYTHFLFVSRETNYDDECECEVARIRKHLAEPMKLVVREIAAEIVLDVDVADKQNLHGWGERELFLNLNVLLRIYCNRRSRRQ